MEELQELERKIASAQMDLEAAVQKGNEVLKTLKKSMSLQIEKFTDIFIV
jgi:hypothetical protein